MDKGNYAFLNVATFINDRVAQSENLCGHGSSKIPNNRVAILPELISSSLQKNAINCTCALET